jgi:hypothetical protein
MGPVPEEAVPKGRHDGGHKGVAARRSRRPHVGAHACRTLSRPSLKPRVASVSATPTPHSQFWTPAHIIPPLLTSSRTAVQPRPRWDAYLLHRYCRKGGAGDVAARPFHKEPPSWPGSCTCLQLPRTSSVFIEPPVVCLPVKIFATASVCILQSSTCRSLGTTTPTPWCMPTSGVGGRWEGCEAGVGGSHYSNSCIL